MASEALFALKEGQFVGYIELIRMAMVFRAPAIGQLRESIRDVVIGSTLGANRRTPRKQLGVHVQQFRVGIAGIKLQAVAHALRRFENKRIIVGTYAVRAIIKGSVDAVGADRSQRSIVAVTVNSVYVF